MKYILIILILTANNSFAQSIINHFNIIEIKQIEITFTPDMSNENSANEVVKIVTEDRFLNQVKMMLTKLPAKGGIYKKFGKNTPVWKIKITDQSNDTHELQYYGPKLRVPDSSNGSFYFGEQSGAHLEKELYLAIRNEMIGDWYNCN